jgi:LrgB-like family
MMPVDVKKVFHPLLLATAVSAIAAVLSDRFMCTGGRHLEEDFGKRGRSWIDSLLCYTTPTASALASGTAAMKTGDYFALVLGPACTALAFRIFSQSEKLQSKLPAILAASAVSAVTSLLVSPLLGAAVGIPAELNAALAHVSDQSERQHSFNYIHHIRMRSHLHCLKSLPESCWHSKFLSQH